MKQYKITSEHFRSQDDTIPECVLSPEDQAELQSLGIQLQTSTAEQTLPKFWPTLNKKS